MRFVRFHEVCLYRYDGDLQEGSGQFQLGLGKVALELMFKRRQTDDHECEGTVCGWKGRTRDSRWREGGE